MDGPAAQHLGGIPNSSMAAGSAHLPEECQALERTPANGRPINGPSVCQTALSRAGSDSHCDAMRSLSIAPIFATWAQEKSSYTVHDSDSGNMHFWPERRAQTGQAGAGWLHNARAGLQRSEEG